MVDLRIAVQLQYPSKILFYYTGEGRMFFSRILSTPEKYIIPENQVIWIVP